MDGDGKPDLIRIIDGELHVARMVPDAESLHAVGRLVQINNGRGGLTRITYGNAKAEFSTPHDVPFPEIVVVKTQVVTEDGSAPSLAPTHFAYGTARLEYDPLAGHWVFPGYQQHISLSGANPEPTVIDGVMTITQSSPAAPPGAAYPDHVRAHRPMRRTLADGTFTLDQLSSFLGDGVPGGFAQVHTQHGSQLVEPSVAVSPIDALECSDLDPATGQPFGYGRCRSAGIAYTRSTEAWEGIAPPPAMTNTLARTSIESVDMYGRPTRLENQGDMRRTDDDICTEITYAVSGNGAFPSVPASVELTDCGYGHVDQGAPPGPPEVISRVRFHYDGFPVGQAVLGRLSKRLVDRFDDSGYLDTYEAESLTYNSMGQVAQSTTPRALGSPATRTKTFTRDAFGATVTQISDAASDLGTGGYWTSQLSTWPSLGAWSSDPHDITNHTEFDGHGRPTREWIEGEEGTRAILKTIAYADDGLSVHAETYPDTEGGEPGRATVHLDRLLRPRFTQAHLGADYGGATVVSDLVEYDSLGRAVFVARPFSTMEVPFRPAGPHPGYGTTSVFDRRGRLLRTVAANGRDDVSVQSSVAADRIVTAFEYGYQDGNAVAIRRGPDETDPTSTRASHRDLSVRTALGHEIERARFDAAGARLDLVRQRWDRLGRITSLDRFADPATGSVPVSWTSRFDSLGRRLSLTEPGLSPRLTSYDELGNPIESWWGDGVKRHITRTRYDGFGRLTDRQLLVSTSGDEQLVSHDRFHYDVHSGEPEQPTDDYWGRLSWSETTGVGKVFQGYDEFGRTSSTSHLYESKDGKKLVRELAEYTAPGRLRSMSLETAWTSDRFNYRYDSAGRVVEVLDERERSYWLARTIDFDGHIAQVMLGNGVVETFERASDGRREPLSWAASTSQGTYRYENVAFDAAGRVTEELLETPTSVDELRSHEFDSLGRLTRSFHINGGLGGSEQYTHDPLGNLISRTATTGIGDRAYQPDLVDPDRLCSFALPGSSGPCTFEYDGMGNVVMDSTYGPMFERGLKYDPAGRVTSIQRASYGAIFSYGPSGRVHTEIDGVADRESWSFGDLVEEHRKGADVFVERRVVGPQGIIATLRHSEREDTIVYTHGDGRANRFFTDEGGDVVQAATYTTFGQAAQTGGTDPLTTTDDLWNGGDDIPELGIVLLGPRVYDPDLGRFLQRDPIAITARSSLANPYAFSFSDPVNHADPSGLTPTVYASTAWSETVGRWVAGGAMVLMTGAMRPRMPDLSIAAAMGVDDAVSHFDGVFRQARFDFLDPVGAAERCGGDCSGGVLDEFIGGVSDGAFNAVENTVLTAYAWPYQAYRAGTAAPGVVHGVNAWAHDPVATWKAMACPGGNCARGAGRLAWDAFATVVGAKAGPAGSTAGSAAEEMVTLCHGTTPSSAARVLKNGFKKSSTFLAEDVHGARYFGGVRMVERGAKGVTVMRFQVPKSLADKMFRGAFGEFEGLPFVDVPYSNGIERVMTWGSVDEFNAAMKSGQIKVTRLKYPGG